MIDAGMKLSGRSCNARRVFVFSDPSLTEHAMRRPRRFCVA
nr:MAG TPA: hypothetical protein [Caudoviricetes sp.]